jgi:hypothetical protein
LRAERALKHAIEPLTGAVGVDYCWDLAVWVDLPVVIRELVTWVQRGVGGLGCMEPSTNAGEFGE